MSPRSSAKRMSAITLRTAVSVEWKALYADCNSGSNLSVFRMAAGSEFQAAGQRSCVVRIATVDIAGFSSHGVSTTVDTSDGMLLTPRCTCL